MWWLSIVWWVAAVTGVAGMIAAMVMERHRRTALWLATGGLTVAGVLGLASIGVFILIGAGVCAVAAVRADSRGSTPDRTSTGRPAET